MTNVKCQNKFKFSNAQIIFCFDILGFEFYLSFMNIMRIAIDCRWIFNKLSGIGRHTDNLVKGLANIDRENTYLLLKEPLIPYGIFSFRNQRRLPKMLKRLDVDIYHSTNYMIPLFMRKKIKVVVTIHDLIPWKFPYYTPKAKKTRFKWLFKLIMILSVRRADKIITVSENTARDIEECLHVKKNKIHVVYNGIDPVYFKEPDVRKEDYILFVGRGDPYKNLSGLVKAYSLLVKKYNIQNKLLVVGEKDPRYPEVENLAEKLNLKDKIVFHGYADTEDLVNIYRKAKVLVMPSFYEGFGLPAIEAMACGTPVIVSNTPSLMEVVKDNAIIIDPYNVNEMAEAVHKVITDRNLAEGLSRKGVVYARQFTIEKMAEETLKVYESCFNS